MSQLQWATDIRLLQVLWDSDWDMEQVWLECNIDGFMPEDPFSGVIDVPLSLMEGIRYMISRSHNGWHHCCASLHRLLTTPSNLGLAVTEALLGEGLDPNIKIISVNLSEDSPHLPLLISAFRGLQLHKKDARSHRPPLNYPPVQHEPDPATEPDSPKPWCIIATLVRSGADIYYLFEEIFDQASTWREISSLIQIAQGFGIFAEWLEALSEVGIDIDQYLWKDLQTRKQAMRLHGAKRSGVDEQVLALPSNSGLRCRRCRRAFCSDHYSDVFEERT